MNFKKEDKMFRSKALGWCSSAFILAAFEGIACFSAEDLPSPAAISAGAGGKGETTMNPVTSSSNSGSSTSSNSSGNSTGMGGGGGNGKPPMAYKCNDIDVEYKTMCDDGNNKDGDSCTADCKCGIDASINSEDDFQNIIDKSFALNANGSCYLWVRTQKQWTEAETLCNKAHMHLASITTVDEIKKVNGFIAKSIQPNPSGESNLTAGFSTWVGGYRKSPNNPDENVWLWVDGIPFDTLLCTDQDQTMCPRNTHVFAPGEPNNYNNQGENCIEIFDDDNNPISLEQDRRLNDEVCDAQRLFLCETLPVP